MEGWMIWVAGYAVYFTLYLLALGAVGMAIQICETLRDGWSDDDSIL